MHCVQVLCGEKNREQIELLQLDQGDIKVQLVELTTKGLLEAKHKAIRLTRREEERCTEK
jgi:hypothetical protein